MSPADDPAPGLLDGHLPPRAVAHRASWVRRALRRPWLALWLWLTWLLLNQTVAPGHLLLGAVLAVTLAHAGPRPAGPTHADAPPRGPRGRRARVAGRLALVVLWDIVVANLQVAARILLGAGSLESRFVWVPLDVGDARAVTLLAGIVTMTPGTLSADLSDDRRYLLVHGLDVDDAGVLAAQIKARYEAPIKELFE